MKPSRRLFWCIAAWLAIDSNASADIPGDADHDGDVDFGDFELLSVCQFGPDIPTIAICHELFDFDFDADVDMPDFAALQRCFSGDDQPGDPDCAPHLARIEEECLHIIGTAADTSLALRLQFGVPSILEVDVGNDGAADFRVDRGQFRCILVDARGGDDQVFIDELNGVFTDTETTTINGGDGNDALHGGSGAETFNGGPGNDSAFLGAGIDRFIWNPGDDTDLIEGGDGIDTVEVNGGNTAEGFTATANGTRVRFDRISPTAFFLDIGACESLVLNADGGNDTLACTGNLAALIQITADGGAGDDTLLGSNGADLLLGGDDNDFVDGNQGIDVALLGAGNDTFQWDPGDGNDTVEGQAGHDVVLFNGSSINEIFELSANGQRLRFTRNVANIVMDADDIEQFDLRALGGPDTVTVNDLTGTDTTRVNVDLAGILSGVTGDAQPDSVVVNATNGIDNMAVTGSGTAASVTGLFAVVNITTAEVAIDRLTVNALSGNDTVQANGLSSGVIALTLSGGIGNDVLIGSAGIDVLNGDDDNDTVTGGNSDDTVQLGIGNDRFIWNPGDDTDVVEGGDGIDTVEVNGGNAAEGFTITANGTRVRFDRISPTAFFLDIGACESLVLNANGGNDTLACTGNLAALIQITADGGAGDDTLLGSNGADLLLGGDDNDFVDGNQGIDVALLGAGNDTFQWDPGDGNDTVEGQAGHDVVLFNGSSINEIFELSANGQRLRFTRNVANIVMDADDIEQFDLRALGGPDTVTVNDLTGTDVIDVNFDLGTVGGDGDAQADVVTVNGTQLPDTIQIAASSGAVEVSGLAAFVRITHPEAANDSLIVNGLGGVDTITAGPGVAALIVLMINP